MRNLFILFLITGLYSCSSAKKASEEHAEELDRQVAPPSEVVYDKNTDYVEVKKSDDILSGESLAKFEDPKIDVVIETTDPLAQAAGYCYRKNIESGLAVLKKVHSQYKKHPGYFNALGTCYYLKNDMIKASLFYNKAIDLDKDYAPAWNNLGVLFLKDKEDQKARDNFKKASDMSPFSATPRFNLAQIYLQYGFVEQAKDMFEGLYNANPSDSDVTIGLANAHLFLGEVEKSIDLFRGLSNKHLVRPEVALNYAVALKMNDQVNASFEIYRGLDTTKLGVWSNYYKRVGKYLGGEK